MNKKMINDYFMNKGETKKDFENNLLEKEFELIKKKHIMRTCFKARERELIEESEKGINIPTFLIIDKIRQEAVRNVLELVEQGDEYVEKYYNQAWEKIAPTLL